jgi:hypothetical protein
MTGIRVRDDESFEKALRRFTKSCEKAGILSDIKNTSILRSRLIGANASKTPPDKKIVALGQDNDHT